MNFSPPEDLANNYMEILERAPYVISELENLLALEKDKLASGRALLTIKYEKQKRDTKIAMIESDENIRSLSLSIAKLSSLLSFWKEAQTNCRSIYRAKTQQ
jgi:hypothetical protein